MTEVKIIQVTPTELVDLIATGVEQKLKEFSIKLNSRSTENLNPHFSRKECAKFLGISLNCLNDWCRKGILCKYQLGQKIYFKREEIEQVMFKHSKKGLNNGK